MHELALVSARQQETMTQFEPLLSLSYFVRNYFLTAINTK